MAKILLQGGWEGFIRTEYGGMQKGWRIEMDGMVVSAISTWMQYFKVACCRILQIFVLRLCEYGVSFGMHIGVYVFQKACCFDEKLSVCRTSSTRLDKVFKVLRKEKRAALCKPSQKKVANLCAAET